MAIFKRSLSLKSISDVSSFAYQETIHLFIISSGPNMCQAQYYMLDFNEEEKQTL